MPTTRIFPPRIRIPVIFAALGILTAVGWALFWPAANCSDPVCVKQRFSLFLEVDALKDIEPFPLEVKTRDGTASMHSVLAAGGVDVTVVRDQTNIPYDPAAGKLDRADLFQLSKTWRSRVPPQNADARMYALLTHGLVSDTGETLFGIMFDYNDREGFAVAPPQIHARFDKNGADDIPVLQMRTFLHEMLHALNRSHLDAAQISGDRLTIEAPTKCIADASGLDWMLKEPPLLALSPATIRFFQTAPAPEVLPGKGSVEYDLQRSSATECEQARANRAPDPAITRWTLARRRLEDLVGFSEASAAAAPQSSAKIGDVRLDIQALPAAYPLGYPVTIRLLATNTGPKPLPIKGRLAPGYGMLLIDTRTVGSSVWRALHPLAWYEPADDDAALLEPGQRTEQTIPIYFGEEGWTFPQEGIYEVRARLALGEDRAEAISGSVMVKVARLAAKRDAGAFKLLLNDTGRLDPEIGRFMIFGGRIGSPKPLAPLDSLVKRYPETALGSALRLTLASHLLRPPLDPTTGSRPKPNLPRARRLLNDLCIDSGLTAMKDQLVHRHRELLPQGKKHDALINERRAWDGVNRRNKPGLETYADPALRIFGEPIRFQYNSAMPSAGQGAAARRMARKLRTAKPQRVVIVGHTDYEGSCGYNDSLAVQRAEHMRRILRNAGIRADVIVTAGLGERRPLEFSTTPKARALNRRVEVLAQFAAKQRR